VQTVDEPARFVQFASQGAYQWISTAGAARVCASIALVGGFELLRDVAAVAVQLVQECSSLCAPSVICHRGILSLLLNVRAPGWPTHANHLEAR
jgi:hypothetical protein